MNEKVNWKRTLFTAGDSTVISIPKELLDYIDAKKGNKVHIIADKGKHGKYIAIWNPKQEK